MKNYVLFGNKIDRPKEEWKISTEEAQKYAEENDMNYYETSCITREGIIEGFSYFVDKIYYKIESEIYNKINIKNKETKKDSNDLEKKDQNNK